MQHTIAVVDDDPGARAALVSLVQALGFRAEPFASAEAILAAAATRTWTMLVADVGLPGISGLDLVRTLAAAGLGLPAVLVTAAADDGLRRRAAAAGLAVMEKPLRPAALDAAIRAALAVRPPDLPASLDGGAANRSEPMTLKATATPGKTLLSPADHTLIMIDFQPQMAFATQSIDGVTLRNNAALVASAAAGFGVSTILTTVAAESFSGAMFSEVTDPLPGQALLDRTSMNAWEDAAVIARVNEIGNTRVVLAGLWTSVCIVGPALSALDQGFEVYVVADACGDVSAEAHERAMERMVQAGTRPMTSVQYLLELQRDWGRSATYDMTTGLAKRYAGGYGIGIGYAKTMFGASEGRHHSAAAE